MRRLIHNSQFTTHNLLVVAGVFFCAIAAAQTEQNPDLQKIRSRISALQEKLAQSEKNVATLSEEVRRLDLKLEIAQREAELVAASREDFARQLAATRAEGAVSAEVSQRLARALVSRARVLHRFGRFGYFRVLLESRDVRDFLQGVERLDALARRDGSLLARYREMEARRAADMAREEALKKELDRLYAEGRKEVTRMASLRRERETLLAREKSASSSRRDEVMALSDKATRLERLLERLAQSSTGQAPDASGGIRPWKGVLDWPARGTLIETFGRHRHPKFDAWTISSGIALSMPAGTPVRAVYSGRAVYAQWLAEYGNLVILDHGDGVFTLYAWLQSVAVQAGGYVAAGAAVGAAGWGPGRDEPGLYFEVRDHQKANDPVAWLR
ncbi:MAG TPA: peptidoglycan DD-metalloendopeptidase family protein [Thermoanaerobaculia bacterium]|nr:peptidoglycan DD-metalloendopeptidase family protein [Thermoanaerobaculia bacterium]